MDKTERPFRPLAATLARTILLGTLACMLLCGAVQGWYVSRAVQQRFETALEDLGQRQSVVAAELLWNLEMEASRVQLAAIARQPHVGYVALVDALTSKDAVFVEVGDARFRGSKGALSFEAIRGGVSIGQLLIAPDRRSMRAEVMRSVGVVLLEVAVLGLLILATVLALLRRHLQRPLAQLAAYAGSVDAEHLYGGPRLDLQRAALPHRNEIDLVAEGFATLQQRIGEHVHTLDQQVAERTAALEAALAQVSTLATTDALTGCRNRGYFAQRYPEELARAQRYGRPLSAIFCDIDHFKAINDAHGHGAGDQVLAAVGRSLRESLRSSGDWVVRWGGEEFVLILPETDLVQALDAAERVRQRVLEQVSLEAGGAVLRVTLSFGVAEHQGGEQGEALLKRADQWLYVAKQQGRNQVQPEPLA